MEQSQGAKRIPVVTNILAANDRVAAENRQRFRAAGIRVLNIISSPGAGKTTLLEKTITALKPEMSIAVVVGDIATTRDAERLAALEVPVVQIMTEAFGGSCHLEASTVRQAVDGMDLTGVKLLIVENIGNLVCPAEFDVGEDAKVVLLSVTEGEDKPLKYPLAFQVASLALITKTDLVPHLELDLEKLRKYLYEVNPKRPFIELSARNGAGMDAWLDWVRQIVKAPA